VSLETGSRAGRAHYGYGLGVNNFDGRRMISHGGRIDGFTAFLAHYPEAMLTIAILANGPTNAAALQLRIAEAVLPPPSADAPDDR
jgi:D-alanyl-D-alanine carboxypeptidase